MVNEKGDFGYDVSPGGQKGGLYFLYPLPVNFVPSHGCIHLKPADRDKIFALGAFKPKTSFTVHKYNERL